MYVRKDRPKDIFPKRLSGLMESYEIEKGRRGISNIGLARLLYQKRNGADDASLADDRYAVEREIVIRTSSKILLTSLVSAARLFCPSSV